MYIYAYYIYISIYIYICIYIYNWGYVFKLQTKIDSKGDDFHFKNTYESQNNS